MKKGMALEGYIMPDKTIRPMKHYDDTKIKADIQTNKDDIDNLKSRVTYLETHGGVEDPTKADKVVEATYGNFAGLDDEGNLTDSGYAPSDFAPVVHGHAISDITGLSNALAGRVSYVAGGIVILKDSSTNTYPISGETAQDAVQDFVDTVAAGKVVVCPIRVGIGTSILATHYGLVWWEDNESDNELTVYVILGPSQFKTGSLQYGEHHEINFTNAAWTKTDLGTF